MRFTRPLICSTIVLSALALTGCACNDCAGDACQDVKAGSITTVNGYCVVNPKDPVNPAIVREHKGQRVGFCCNGCTKKWDGMTDDQKDAAIRTAVAKGRP